MHMCCVVGLRRAVKIGDATVMHVAGGPECDPNCHERSGCSRRGEGKCDRYCITGYGLTDTYTCTSVRSECDY